MTKFPPIHPRLATIWHGGDYNPEQWPASVWDEDVRLMQASHFRVATVGVLSWVTLQPAEDRFAFEFRRWLQARYASLDEINQRWWLPFWSHTFTEWDQIEPPYANGESLTAGLTIDYKRFQSDSLMFHGAVVELAGRSDTRVFREVTALGAELERLGNAPLGALTPARVAVLFDWNNWWAIDNSVGPVQQKDYVATVRKYYRAGHRRNVGIDVVFSDSDLAKYDVVLAPMLHMVKQGRGRARPRSGNARRHVYHDRLQRRGRRDRPGVRRLPGPAAATARHLGRGDRRPVYGQTNDIVLSNGSTRYTCSRLCEIVRLEGASVVATFGDDFYAGSPAVTRNRVGDGQTYYIASDPEDAFLDAFLGRVLEDHGIRAPLAAPPGVEVAERVGATAGRLLFVLNHTSALARVALPEGQTFRELITGTLLTGALDLPATDVAILVQT